MNKPYQTYKDSGVEWIGDIPSHWNLVPCRTIVSNRDERNDNEKEKNYLSLMANRGIIPYKEKGDVGNKKPEDLSKCKIVKKGDLVINSMNYSIGSYGMSPYDGVCSPVYIVLNSNKRHIENRYALRIFENKSLQKHLAAFGNGILAHRAAIKWDDIRNQYVPLPPLNEQRVILERLDKETSRIDSLIFEKNNFINLLKEKRQALISHVVTKGLDTDVEMKDSGVEWIGEIPKHWISSKLKHALSIRNGRDYKDVEAITLENSFPVYGSGGEFRRSTDYLYDGDSILFGRKGTVDKPLHVSGKFWTVDTMFYSELKADFDPRFMYYVALTIPYSYYQTNTALPSMTQGDLLNNPIAHPEYEEQTLIARQLDAESDRIDSLISEVLKSIELLKEHRAALISAAVTGKIDLRDKEIA